MNTFFLIVSLIPLIAVNVWHNVLLSEPTAGHKPRSISEHAASSPHLLLRHRIAHTVGSIFLSIYGLFYLLPHGHSVAASLLIGAAIFDVIEVVTLNKKSASEITALNYHVVTAWAMALCYLLYASVAVTIAGLSSLFVFMIWISFAALLITAVLRKFKDFWITQHIYFCFLALIMAIGQIALSVR